MHNNYNKAAIELELIALKKYIKFSNVLNIKQLFAETPDRFEQFSLSYDDLLFDFSKTPIDQKVLKHLFKIVELAEVKNLAQAMFAGELINYSEARAVLHTALREPCPNKAEITFELEKLRVFCSQVRDGTYKSYSNKIITDVVNIGIGGSNLGPHMVLKALAPYSNGKLKCHFVANIDSAAMADCLKNLDSTTTLFIITSKTFTTKETIENAIYAKLWLGEAWKQQFVAITSNIEKAKNFGIKPEHCFCFWDWVGGRYSLWSSVALPIVLAIGFDNFKALLAGAHTMDQHFLHSKAEHNMALLFGVINYYYRMCCNYNNVAIVPYEQRLVLLPNYLQQLLMESNGKIVDRNGAFVAHPTGAIIWGDVGTNAQHAFFQLLHQGSEKIPVEFIAFAQGFEDSEQAYKQRQMLLANCLAQSQALLEGKEHKELHKYFAGNRPSITILLKKLTPYQLGQLLALYEHRTFVEGALFNINSFDQWGVELGKTLAKDLYEDKVEKKYTKSLLKFLQQFNNNV